MLRWCVECGWVLLVWVWCGVLTVPEVENEVAEEADVRVLDAECGAEAACVVGEVVGEDDGTHGRLATAALAHQQHFALHAAARHGGGVMGGGWRQKGEAVETTTRPRMDSHGSYVQQHERGGRMRRTAERGSGREQLAEMVRQLDSARTSTEQTRAAPLQRKRQQVMAIWLISRTCRASTWHVSRW